MPKTTRLNGCLDEIELGFVERETTPRMLMMLSIQVHLSILSLSNIVLVLYIFGVDRAHSTVHNWVHKADLQPDGGKNLDYVAVDETVLQFDEQQYWLYAAVDPDSNDLLHTQLEPTRANVIAENSSLNSASNTTSTMPGFSSTARHRYRKRATVTACNFALNATGIATEWNEVPRAVGQGPTTASNVSFVR